ncbi:hypothetical protein [Chelatococcus reniformis]|uniref:hypothetical protein n=1 Tax=Chelatococcus reniformis TaxID=1494448 RepID=UPI001668177E|nr:hypothetical protein [Chelatococcus reniformis]
MKSSTRRLAGEVRIPAISTIHAPRPGDRDHHRRRTSMPSSPALAIDDLSLRRRREHISRKVASADESALWAEVF